jgi:CRP-like cAMP-binding protein
MVRYHQISQTEKDEHRVLEQTVLEESIPIMSTSIALACGFGALAMSDFPPIAYFGLLSAMVMLLALVATFIITPTLLSFTRLITVWDLLSVHLQTEITHSCKLFTGMRPSQIKRAILLSSVHTFAKGELVIKEGDVGRDFFVILEGAADAQITPPNEKTINLRRMGTGDVFGEIALVSNVPRTADVVAHQDLKVLVMDWDSISQITKVYPRISARLFRNLSSILGERLACNTPNSQTDEA